MNLKAYIVLHTLDEKEIVQVQEKMSSLGVQFQFSPYRSQQSLHQCVEFYGSAQCDQQQFEQLIPKLNAFWNVDQEYYEDYGFNTKMFDERVYYLSIETL